MRAVRTRSSGRIAVCVQQSLLIFAIIFFVGNKALAAGMPRLPDVAKHCSPRPSVYVEIINTTEYVRLPLLFSSPYNPANIPQYSLYNLRLPALNQCASDRDPHLGGRENVPIIITEEIYWQSLKIFFVVPVREDGHAICRSLPKIPHRRNEKVAVYMTKSDIRNRFIIWVMLARRLERNLFDSDIGSKLPLLRFLYRTQLLLPDGPQSNSRDPEPSGEEREESG